MKKSCFTILLLLTAFAMHAQIVSAIDPPVWASTSLANQPQARIELATQNLSAIKAQDSIEAKYKDIAWRFGVAIDSTINVKTESNLEQNGNLTRLQLEISSANAKSINLNFSNFFLPSGALLYIKGRGRDRIGALTNKNNKRDKQFSIRPIKGSSITIELYVASEKLDSVHLIISQIVHGYRNVFQKSAKNFNSSGACNRNINCPEADLWQDVKRSVVMITASNNTRLCTGTLMNNVREDSVPYLLTASHCNLASNSIFIFNYENSSTNCLVNLDGNLTNSISGAFARSESSYSDFKLFELSQQPPASYNAYYAGWSAISVPPIESTSIHHPSGDIKKISQDFDTAKSTFYNPPNQNTHWQIGNWESGTTEQGSSGSALFDQFKRVVGQLEGGSANCSNNSNDYFGKFSLSWDFDPASNRQLKYWLDPDTTNRLIMDGLDPSAKVNNNDVELTYVEGIPSFSCDSFINPVVYFLNVGNDTLTSVQIQYGTNKQFSQTVSWSGQLSEDKMAQISLPAFQLSSMDSSFNVKLVISPSDQDTNNNVYSKGITANLNSIATAFAINTDQYGYETSWEIRDSGTNQLLLKGGPYVESFDTTGQTIRDSLCLYNGCFQLTIFDSFGDGFNGPFYGNGYVLIQDRFGDTLLYEASFTTFQKTINFCVRDTLTSLEEAKEKMNVNVFPNPIKAGNTLNLHSRGELNMQIQLIDLQGKVIAKARGNSIAIPERISAGFYFVDILNKDGLRVVRKIIVD